MLLTAWRWTALDLSLTFLAHIHIWKPPGTFLHTAQDQRETLRWEKGCELLICHITQDLVLLREEDGGALPSNAYFVRGDMLWVGGHVCGCAKRVTAAMRRGSWYALTC